MITVIKTTSGNFNVFGTNDEGFCLQGNLNETELRQLKAEVDREIKKIKTKS